MKRILLLAAGLITGAALALPFAASPDTTPTANALAGGQSTSVSCSGVSISVTPQSATAITVTCNAAPTTPTTQPPATTTTTAPPVTTTTQPPAGRVAKLGLWNNGTSASQLGVTEQVVSDYAYGSNSTTYAASGAQAASGKLLMLGVGALTQSQAVAIGNELKAGGQPDAIIRPMWEMNQGGWFSAWNEKTYTAAQYEAEWETIVNGFRSVAGADFRFDYNLTACNNNIAGRSNFDSFPGDAYVDFIGVDVYDNNGSVAASQACITADAQFAQNVGLPWTIPEWGLVTNSSSTVVDDPEFVTMISNDSNLPTCWLEALFSGLGGKSISGASILKAPNSLAAYRADFGS